MDRIFKAWTRKEKLKYDQHAAGSREHRSSNISHPGENVAHAQTSVSHEEDEIQNSKFEYGSNKCPSEEPEEDDRKPAAKRIKKEPEDEAQNWAQDEQKKKPHLRPGKKRKTVKLYSGSLYLFKKMVKNIMM